MMVSRSVSMIHYCHPTGGRHPLFTLTTCDVASPLVGVLLSPFVVVVDVIANLLLVDNL